MKTKKIIPVLSALVLAAGFCGCSSASSVGVTFYWNPNENNQLLYGTEESYEYDVYLKTESGENTYYSVDYKDGKYVSKLSCDEEHADCYRLETELTISVRFTCGEEQSDWFEDSTKTTVVFKANNSLQPVRSEKTVVSHSPTSFSPSVLLSAYTMYDYTVITEYNNDASAGTCVRTDNTDTKTTGDYEKTFSVPKKYSYFDNEQFPFLLRGMNFSSQQNVYSYNASARGVQTLKIAKDETSSGTYSLALNGVPLNDTAIDYVSATLSLSTSSPGATQTFFLAKDASGNKYRHMILRMETPLSYQLGTLVYELKKAETIGS